MADIATLQATDMLTAATNSNASDIFIIAGRPLTYKVNGFMHTKGERLMPDITESLIRQIYILAQNRKIDSFLESGDDDFSFAIPGLSRYRVSTYKQRGSLAAVIRVIAFELPDPALLGIPDSILQLTDLTKGMLLVTGPAGSGKSTTLACLIDASTRHAKITSLPWRILWNSCTTIKKVLSVSAKSQPIQIII